MWFYTQVDTDKKLETSQYDCDAPNLLSLLGQGHVSSDQPVLILRRDGKTVALMSESVLPTSVYETSNRTEKKADTIVLVPIPSGQSHLQLKQLICQYIPTTSVAYTDQVRARSRAPTKGILATLEDLYKDGLSDLYQMQRTTLQLLPLSELPTRVADMWGRVHLEGMYVSKGLAPFALPPGTPRLETILAWASNRDLDGALKSKCSTPLQGNIYTTYHRDMLKRFGIYFGEEGGFSFINVKRFPPLVMPSDLGALRIAIDYVGGVDCALLPYGGLVRDIRIGFVHLPLPQANEGHGAASHQESDFEECKARAMLTLVSAIRQQCEPFHLDMTDGTRHHILYRTHNTHVMVHTDCTPVEAYYLLSGLLKGEMTYGGEAPDPGHFRCPATPRDNPEAPAVADSSGMSGTMNADSAKPYVEDAVLQPAKPSPGTDKSHSTDSENDRCSMDEEKALQLDGEESESGCSEAAVSDGDSDSCWSTCLDADWQVI